MIACNKVLSAFGISSKPNSRNVASITFSDVVSPMYTVVYRLSNIYQGQVVSAPEPSLVTGEAIVMYEVMVQ